MLKRVGCSNAFIWFSFCITGSYLYNHIWHIKHNHRMYLKSKQLPACGMASIFIHISFFGPLLQFPFSTQLYFSANFIIEHRKCSYPPRFIISPRTAPHRSFYQPRFSCAPDAHYLVSAVCCMLDPIVRDPVLSQKQILVIYNVLIDHVVAIQIVSRAY